MPNAPSISETRWLSARRFRTQPPPSSAISPVPHGPGRKNSTTTSSSSICLPPANPNPSPTRATPPRRSRLWNITAAKPGALLNRDMIVAVFTVAAREEEEVVKKKKQPLLARREGKDRPAWVLLLPLLLLGFLLLLPLLLLLLQQTKPKMTIHYPFSLPTPSSRLRNSSCGNETLILTSLGCLRMGRRARRRDFLGELAGISDCMYS